MSNSGQVCIRSDYCFVHESVVDEFLKKVIVNTEAITQGGKFKQMLGKVINEPSYNRICDLLDPADHKGQVIYGNANAHIDRNLTPTIVLKPSVDSGMMKGEIFGPILPVLTFNA